MPHSTYVKYDMTLLGDLPAGGQHGFYARPSAHLRSLATLVGLGTISLSSDIVGLVQGGVVKTVRSAA